jgi:hypothetical protein
MYNGKKLEWLYYVLALSKRGKSHVRVQVFFVELHEKTVFIFIFDLKFSKFRRK